MMTMATHKVFEDVMARLEDFEVLRSALEEYQNRVWVLWVSDSPYQIKVKGMSQYHPVKFCTIAMDDQADTNLNFHNANRHRVWKLSNEQRDELYTALMLKML